MLIFKRKTYISYLDLILGRLRRSGYKTKENVFDGRRLARREGSRLEHTPLATKQREGRREQRLEARSRHLATSLATVWPKSELRCRM